MNLTAVRDPKETVRRHFGESFFAARHLIADKTPASAIDFGSGAGFPGLPLAIYSPGTEVTLLESNSKKVAFLNEVIRELGLSNAHVPGSRAENFKGGTELVTMRAVEKFEVALKLAAGLVKPKGRLALMISSGQKEQAVTGLPEFAWQGSIGIPEGHSRILLVGTKIVKVD